MLAPLHKKRRTERTDSLKHNSWVAAQLSLDEDMVLAKVIPDAEKTLKEQLSAAIVSHFPRVLEKFEQWDVEGSGKVSKKGFRSSLFLLGLRVDRKQARSIRKDRPVRSVLYRHWPS